MKKKIIISGGGTLGHILPIIPVVMDLYAEYDLYFIGTNKGLERKYIEDNKLTKYFKNTYYFDMIGVNRKNILKNMKLLYKYYIIRKKLKKLYKKIKPDLIIGMGGYISGVVINVGIGLNIKTIIHEQNKKRNTIRNMIEAVNLSLNDDYAKFYKPNVIQDICTNILNNNKIKGDTKRKHARYLKELIKHANILDPKAYPTNLLNTIPNIAKTKKSEKLFRFFLFL